MPVGCKVYEFMADGLEKETVIVVLARPEAIRVRVRVRVSIICVMHQQDRLLSCQLHPTFPPAWKEWGAIRL